MIGGPGAYLLLCAAQAGLWALAGVHVGGRSPAQLAPAAEVEKRAVGQYGQLGCAAHRPRADQLMTGLLPTHAGLDVSSPC